MAHIPTFLANMQTASTAALDGINGLTALNDQYTALGGAEWLSDEDLTGYPFTQADIDAVLQWLPYVRDTMTHEVRGALYRLQRLPGAPGIPST